MFISINKHVKAFTLLELSLVLMIVGIVAAAGLQTARHIQRTRQATITQQHLRLILDAAALHVQLKGYLPCPAASGTTDGRAQETCLSIGRHEGPVPYKTLGLQRDVTLDGRGQPMTYAVAPSDLVAGIPDPSSGYSLRMPTTRPPSQLLIGRQLSLTDTPPIHEATDWPAQIVVLVVSHGPLQGPGSAPSENANADLIYDRAHGLDRVMYMTWAEVMLRSQSR